MPAMPASEIGESITRVATTPAALLDDLERQLVADAMRRAGGVKAEAARLLGVKPSALYYKLEKYGIGVPGEGEGP